MKAYADVTDSRVVKALAHPLRVQILAALDDRVASPNELANELEADLGSVSYHVRRLVHLGFLEQVRQTPRRGAIEHYYTAIVSPRITDDAWSTVPTIVKRAMIGATLETFGRHVTAAAGAGGFDVADAHITRTPLEVDAQGWRELAAELRALTDRIAQIQDDSADRLAQSAAPVATPATVVLMLFDSSPADHAPIDADHSPATRRKHASPLADAALAGSLTAS
jgi:DNA-binding transcriptional ArsR family regulator